jgi:hypothetical protein
LIPEELDILHPQRLGRAYHLLEFVGFKEARFLLAEVWKVSTPDALTILAPETSVDEQISFAPEDS